jgi:hypothetical protein
MMRHYSLIDGALVYDAICNHPLFTDPAVNWCAPLLPTEKRCLAGPILIDMALVDAAGAEARSAVDAVLGGFPGRLHCSTLQSQADLATLAGHLQRFTCFYDQDAVLLGLRFADARILVHLPAIMTPQQWGEMTGPIEQWSTLDRRGEEVVLMLPEDRASLIPEDKQFALSGEQMATFAVGAEPDMLLEQLVGTKHATRGHLYDDWRLACECVAIWQESGSDNQEVLLSFARKIFSSKGRALQERDWVSFLAHAGPQEISDS